MLTSPALSAVLDDLVADGTLSPVQALRVAERLAAIEPPTAAAIEQPAPTAAPRRSGRLAEIAGYAGGALLLGACALFVASGWQDLSKTSRELLMTGVALLLALGGAALARGSGTSVRALGRTRDSARRRLVSVLWTFAAYAAGAVAALAADDHELVAAGAVSLLFGVGCYLLAPGAVAQFGAWLAAIGFLSGLIDEIGNDPGNLPYAAALVLLGALWVGLAVRHVLREQEWGLALGFGLALVAAQLPVMGSGFSGLGYALTATVAIAGFAGYLSTRSWSVLGAGVLATTLVVPEALYDWTGGSLPAAGSLLIAGVALLSSSAVGLRLRREVG